MGTSTGPTAKTANTPEMLSQSRCPEVTQEMSTLDAMEEHVYQMQTENEVATLLLESWSLSMKKFMQDLKSIFDKFHSLLS